MSVENCKGEAELLVLLKGLHITLPTIQHEEKHTVEEANKELERFGTPCIGTKNMFLKSKKGELVLVTAIHTTKTDMKQVQKAAGTKDLRFAPEEYLTENLSVVQGSVTPFALVNNLDKRNIVVLLDKNLKDSPIPFVLHPCRNDKSCLVVWDNLVKFMDKIGYPYKVVDFSTDPPKVESHVPHPANPPYTAHATEHVKPEVPKAEQNAAELRATGSIEDCRGFDEVKATFQELGQEPVILPHDEKASVDDVLVLLKEQKGIAAAGTKTLFLKSKKGDLVMVTALREVPTDLKAIQSVTGTKELRFASSEVLHDNLKVVQGCVTPFPLINNLEKRNITVLVDKSVEASPIPLAFCVCRNDRTIVVTFDQLKMYMDKIAYPYKMVDFSTVTASPTSATSPGAKADGKHAAPAPTKAAAAPGGAAGETKLGIAVKREDNFSAWYIDVITKAEMIEYYDVSGCYIIRPWAFYVWKCVQRFLGGKIERMGVEDCYFPMFVSRSCLEREKEHIEGFAPEVAWVTRAGDTDLEQPVAVRPTSETVMYPYYGKWIRSHRDLPVRLNMWNNVIRWEFSHPTPFIRTREFLWQEGHCAWAKAEDCAREVLDILECYAAVYEQLLAVPVVRGKKTEKEKFAGGYYTTTVETYIEAVGRGCQGATSHNLGQNFGKMFDINFQDPDNNDKVLIPWQNSWGLSTRVIGVMIMVHGDNRGMVMPPRVASTQVVIIPVGITKDTTEAEREELLKSCRRLEGELCDCGVRAKCDLRDNYSPGWRFNHWEVKGVPLRVELGPKELAQNKLAVALRFNGEKRSIAWNPQTPTAIAALLEDIQAQMYARAKETMDSHRVRVTEWSEFVPALNRKCVILAPWCGSMECEDQVKKDSAEESKAAQSQEVREDARAPSMGAKTLCIPFAQPGPVEGHTCICKSCTKPATTWVLFGRSY